MNFNFSIGKFRFGLGSEPKPVEKTASRSFGSAGSMNRLNADWLMPQTNADFEIWSGLKILRGRARELERTNWTIQKYLSLLDNNVLGASGVGLQMKVKDPSGSLDKLANKTILEAWQKWTKREYCTPSGKYCWREIEGLALRRAACDGGILVRIIRRADNPFSFSVQPLEMDYLDSNYNLGFADGTQIRFGIEFDVWQKPVAFHMFKAHPGDMWRNQQLRERIPASDILHIYHSDRPGQSIGVPWLTCVMQELEHLGKYREAELVAARLEACKGYVIEQEVPEEGFSGATNDAGQSLQEMTPGMGLKLDPGQKLAQITPTHPNQAFGDFIKSALRGIAGGLSVNYNSLANDLESVNYSSMRAGKLEEIEEYKNIQGWLIESLHEPVFKAWLEMALISGAIRMPNGSALPLTKFDKFNAPDWKPRRWPWVDPLKDLQASVMAVEKGFKSRREIISEMGGDVEEVFLEQSEDEQLADNYGLQFPLGANPQNPPVTNEEEDNTETAPPAPAK
jgi:lambda family phage portal protein